MWIKSIALKKVSSFICPEYNYYQRLSYFLVGVEGLCHITTPVWYLVWRSLCNPDY